MANVKTGKHTDTVYVDFHQDGSYDRVIFKLADGSLIEASICSRGLVVISPETDSVLIVRPTGSREICIRTENEND